jgi:CRP/FNR family transcriptional regulator, cyclic AMP receptor protein
MDKEALMGALASFSLFADLSDPELEGIAHTFDEEWYSEGQRILRRGFAGSGFHLILEGEAAVRINGDDRAHLARGDFFGEISALLGELPSADVVALTPLRCLLLPGTQLHDWLMAKPAIAFRMLQTELRRLRIANEWRS